MGRDASDDLRPAAAGRPDRAAADGHRRRAQDVEVLRQPDRDHRAAGGDLRQDAEHPGRAAGGVVRAAPRRVAARRIWARATPSARSRGRWWRASTARRRPPRPPSASTACSSSASCPRTSRRPRSRPANGVVHLPVLIAEVFGGSRSDARRTLAQGGVKLDGEPLPPTGSTSPAPRSTGACCRSASGAVRPAAARLTASAVRTPVSVAPGDGLLVPSRDERVSGRPDIPGERAKLHCPLGSHPPGEREIGGIPSTGAPVFENSTACTHGPLPGGRYVRPDSTWPPHPVGRHRHQVLNRCWFGFFTVYSETHSGPAALFMKFTSRRV